MTVDERLDALRDLIQQDVNNRGLRTDPADNLVARTAGDFAAACRGLAAEPAPSVAVVTGFFIPHGQPPACETDGPPGAVFLARALSALRIPVVLIADPSLRGALAAGLEAAGLSDVRLADVATAPDDTWTHLIALERVGPSHADGRCYSMRGRDVSAFTGPAHRLFERTAAPRPCLTTIGIGDGGNEIGMGKIPRETIRRNIPNGDLIACRVPTDHLIVAGVSNWGAYALAAGVLLLRGESGVADLFDPERERRLLRVMVERGPLVDGVTGQVAATVDGLTWEQYAAPLEAMARLLS